MKEVWNQSFWPLTVLTLRVVLFGMEARAEEPVLHEARRFRLPPTTLPVKDAIIKSLFS